MFLVAQSGGVAHLHCTFPDVNIVTGAINNNGLREVCLKNAVCHKMFPNEDRSDNEEQLRCGLSNLAWDKLVSYPCSSCCRLTMTYFGQVTGITYVNVVQR